MHFIELTVSGETQAFNAVAGIIRAEPDTGNKTKLYLAPTGGTNYPTVVVDEDYATVKAALGL